MGQFEEKYADPAAFRFADFAGPSEFQAPTAEAMRADPGYQARMDAVKNAQVAGAAHGAPCGRAGFRKASRKPSAIRRRRMTATSTTAPRPSTIAPAAKRKSTYGLNQGNTFQSFNTNTANRLQGYQTRQGAWQANADTALREGELGYNIASGAWDRNYGKARQGYQDEQQHNAQVAAAAGANANAQHASAISATTRAVVTSSGRTRIGNTASSTAKRIGDDGREPARQRDDGRLRRAG